MLWIREVNKSFKEYLTTLYADLIKSDDIKVLVRNPQTNALAEHIPCIAVFSYDLGVNYPMTDLNSTESVKQGETITVSEKPLKHNIGVQIDLFTKSPSLLDTLSYRLIMDKKPRSVIDITDSEGNIYSCPFKRNPTPVRLDTQDVGSMLYRVTYTHVITIPLTYKPQTYAMVDEINPTVKN